MKYSHLTHELSKLNTQQLEEALAELSSFARQDKILNAIRTGMLPDSSFMFRSKNGINFYKGDEISLIHTETATAFVSSNFGESKVTSSMLQKLPVLDVVFNPSEVERIKENKFNTFSATGYVKDAPRSHRMRKLSIEAVKSYENTYFLLKSLFNANDEHILHFMNWLSACFNERKKLGVCYILKGIQGAGKNVFYDNYIVKALGEKHAITVDNARLQGKFNSYLDNTLFIAWNEIKGNFNESNTTSDLLKGYISESLLQIEAKGVNSQMKPSYFNSLMFSNHEVPFVIEPSDRRFVVIETSSVPLRTAVENTLNISMIDFINKIKSEADSFIDFIFSIDYDLNKASLAFSTEAKKVISNASVSSLKTLANDLKVNRNSKTVESLFSQFLELKADYKGDDFEKSLKSFLTGFISGKMFTFDFEFALSLLGGYDKATQNKKNKDIDSFFGKSTSSLGKRYRKIGEPISEIKDAEKFLNELMGYIPFNETVSRVTEKAVNTVIHNKNTKESKYPEDYIEFFSYLDELCEAEASFDFNNPKQAIF